MKIEESSVMEELVDGNRHIMTNTEHSPEPVSYTHLDVYKRQTLERDHGSRRKVGSGTFMVSFFCNGLLIVSYLSSQYCDWQK